MKKNLRPSARSPGQETFEVKMNHLLISQASLEEQPPARAGQARTVNETSSQESPAATFFTPAAISSISFSL